jgi:hypothetical protein
MIDEPLKHQELFIYMAEPERLVPVTAVTQRLTGNRHKCTM